MDNVLLVTATAVEAQAVLDLFSKASGAKWKRLHIDNKTYYSFGSLGGADVFMVQSQMGTGTPGGALQTVLKGIEALSPAAVIMVGIAFGTKPEKHKLCDILVARQIQAYEPQRITAEGPIPRGGKVDVSALLLDKFDSGLHDWEGAPVHFGLLLSGEKLIDDLEFRKKLLSLEPEAIGGEMEATGLYVAAHDAQTHWIVVKAICDWADGMKDNKHQPMAAWNAAAFTLHIIQQGGLAPQRHEKSLILHQSAGAIGVLEDYQTKYSSRERDKWVPTAIFDRQTRVGRESIKDCLLGAQSCLIEGGSGMGKSCLAQSIAAEIGCADRLVIEFNAGYFNGNLEERLDDSVGAHVASTLNRLLACGDAFGKGLVLLVDGWNECKLDFRQLLGQQLDKMVNRHGVTLFVTSQFLPKEITTPLEVFRLGALERADKLTIAGLDENSESKLSDLIDIIRNGIDAKIIGELAGEIQGFVSRAELFDAFIRKRIGVINPISTEVFDAMTLAARFMHDDLSTSLPITRLHLLTAASGNTGSLIHSMEESGLFSLDHYRRYASFTHEQYQHFFAAWGIVRDCATVNDLIAALEMPRNMEIRTFVLGLYAICKPFHVLAEIVRKLTTTDILDVCLSGQCGTDLRKAAEELIGTTFELLGPEISNLTFVRNSTKLWGLEFGKSSMTWTQAERWAFGTLGKRLSQGSNVTEFLNLAKLMDKRLELESKRLVGKREDPKDLFENAFAAVYVFNHPDAPGFTFVMAALRSWRIKSSYEQTVPHQNDLLELLRSHQRLTSGQLYLLLELARHGRWDGTLLGIMPDLVPDVWQKGPYHIRLELMELLQMASGYSDDEVLKNKLAGVLQELYSNNPFINPIITEAVTSLIELESGQTEDEYYSAIRRLLNTPDDATAQEQAYGYYVAQIDHPTDSREVGSAIECLGPDEKGIFLVMAAKAMKQNSFLADILLGELCELLPPGAESVFRNCCCPPDPHETFFQDQAAKFFYAAIGLAKLGVEFPTYGAQSETNGTWWAVGELFYWMNLDTENPAKTVSSIEAVWDRLRQHLQPDAWSVIAFVLNDCVIARLKRKFQTALLPRFLGQVKFLATRQLMSFQSENKAHGNARDILSRLNDPISSAISFFNEYGAAEDKEILMRLIDAPDYGEEIVRAFRNIRERGSGSST
jgi:nucleoside phosphorylase